MALYSVRSSTPPTAADLNQIITLLSGGGGPQAGSVTVSNRIRAQLTGATATSGLAGMTATNLSGLGPTVGGPPTSGTFALGDLAVDPFLLALWVCTTAGSPGTWFRIGGANTVAAAAAPLSATTGQNFSARTGRTGFDVVVLNQNPNPTSSIVVQYAGTYVFLGLMGMSGATSGADSAVMILKNGAVYQFGSQFLGYGSPALGVMSVIRCIAGDVIQLALYTEGAYSQSANATGLPQAQLQGVQIGN